MSGSLALILQRKIPSAEFDYVNRLVGGRFALLECITN